MNSENQTTWSEDEYVNYLNMERNLYSWCLEHYGDFTHEEARKEALNFYIYQSEKEEFRGLVFHDEAWHWAMLKIYGENYWLTKPELSSPCENYERESQKYL